MWNGTRTTVIIDSPHQMLLSKPETLSEVNFNVNEVPKLIPNPYFIQSHDNFFLVIFEFLRNSVMST